jgi:hypothetical protein
VPVPLAFRPQSGFRERHAQRAKLLIDRQFGTIERGPETAMAGKSL